MRVEHQGLCFWLKQVTHLINVHLLSTTIIVLPVTCKVFESHSPSGREVQVERKVKDAHRRCVPLSTAEDFTSYMSNAVCRIDVLWAKNRILKLNQTLLTLSFLTFLCTFLCIPFFFFLFCPVACLKLFPQGQWRERERDLQFPMYINK